MSLGHSFFTYKIGRIIPISKGDNVCKSYQACRRHRGGKEKHWRWRWSWLTELFQSHFYSELSSHSSWGQGPSLHGTALVHTYILTLLSEYPGPQAFQNGIGGPGWREGGGVSTQPCYGLGKSDRCILALLPLGFLPPDHWGGPFKPHPWPWSWAVILVPKSHLLLFAMSKSFEILINCQSAKY